MKGALIGCGFFAQNHLHAWRDIVGVEIIAICDSDAARLKATSAALRVSGLLCMSKLVHASDLKEHDDNDDIQRTTRRTA